MNPSIPRPNVRQHWPLLVAAAALITAILLIRSSVEYKDFLPDNGASVNYWGIARPIPTPSILNGLCLGFWIFLPVLATIVRRQKAIIILLTDLAMLIASIVMCQASGLSLNSTNYLQDEGTVRFDQHIYHLADFVQTGPLFQSGNIYHKLVLFECDSSDTQCTGHLFINDRATEDLVSTGMPVTLTVDPFLNQLQVRLNDKVSFKLDAGETLQ